MRTVRTEKRAFGQKFSEKKELVFQSIQNVSRRLFDSPYSLALCPAGVSPNLLNPKSSWKWQDSERLDKRLNGPMQYEGMHPGDAGTFYGQKIAQDRAERALKYGTPGYTPPSGGSGGGGGGGGNAGCFIILAAVVLFALKSFGVIPDAKDNDPKPQPTILVSESPWPGTERWVGLGVWVVKITNSTWWSPGDTLEAFVTPYGSARYSSDWKTISNNWVKLYGDGWSGPTYPPDRNQEFMNILNSEPANTFFSPPVW